MRDGLNEEFARLTADDEAWVGIVTGTDRAFFAGADSARSGTRRASSPARSGSARR